MDEMRYQFAGRIEDGAPVMDATFRGPEMGAVFALSLSDSRQMRDDLNKAVRELEAMIPRRR